MCESSADCQVLIPYTPAHMTSIYNVVVDPTGLRIFYLSHILFKLSLSM